MAVLDGRVREFVSWARVARLATVGADGAPHVVPVCPLLEDDTIYLATERATPKVRNMRANPNVALVVDEYSEEWDTGLRGVLVHGRAAEVDRPEFERLRAALYEKYLQYEPKATIGEESTIFGISIDRVTSWGI